MELKLLRSLDAIEAWLVRNSFGFTEEAIIGEAQRSIDLVQILRMMLLQLCCRLDLIESSVVEDFLKLVSREGSEAEGDDTEEEPLDPDRIFPAIAADVLSLVERMAASLDDPKLAAESRRLHLQANFEFSSLVACYWTGRLCERLRRLCREEEHYFATILQGWITTGQRDEVAIFEACLALAPESDDVMLEDLKVSPFNEITTEEMFRNWNTALRNIVELEGEL